jgi:hypothetical protein
VSDSKSVNRARFSYEEQLEKPRRGS